MNKIYKVIFNKSTGTFTAVSEFAKAEGKSSTSTVGSTDIDSSRGFKLSAAVGAILAALATISATSAYAATQVTANGVTAMSNGGFVYAETLSTRVAVGYETVANSGEWATSVGSRANATGGATSIGYAAIAGKDSTAIGGLATAGYTANRHPTSGIVTSAAANGAAQAVALGYKATASGDQSLAIGGDTRALGGASIAIGGDDLDAVSKANLNGSAATALNGGNINTAFKAISGVDLVDTANQYPGTTSSGQGAVAIGVQAVSAGHLATAVGTTSNASGMAASALGVASQADGNGSIAIGPNAVTNSTGTEGIAIGARTRVTADSAVAIANGSTATGVNAVAIANTSSATANDAIAIGNSTDASALRAAALGANATASGMDSITIGTNTTSSGQNANAMGLSANSSGTSSFAMGTRANASGESAYAIGTDAIANNTKSIAIGSESKSSEDKTIAIGDRANASGYHGISIGAAAAASGNTSMALGDQAIASSNYSFAAGGLANATAQYSTAIGANANATGEYSTALGKSANATGRMATALGINTNATGPNATAVGSNATAAGTGGLAMGVNAVAGRTGTGALNNAIAIGTNASSVGGHSSIATGTNATASNHNAIATGTDSKAQQQGSIAIGQNATSANIHALALGTNATANLDRSVALGAYSTVSAAVQNPNDTFNGITYNFAGGTPAAGDVVSVGSADRKRQIQNVAAGQISDVSTDAINGSQLYSVITESHWKLQAKGNAVDNVNFGDTVNFNSRDNSIDIQPVSGSTSEINLQVNRGTGISLDANGGLTVTKTTLDQGPQTMLFTVPRGQSASFVNAGDLARHLNNAGFKLAVGGTDGGVSSDTASDEEAKRIRTGEVLTMTAGKGMNIKQVDHGYEFAVDSAEVGVAGNKATVPAGSDNKMVTVGSVAKAINESGFTLKTSANGGELVAGSGDEVINPADTVDMAAGKNLTVKQDANGKITYATKDDVTFNTTTTNNLTVNPNGNVNMGGNTINNVGSGGDVNTNAANIGDVKKAKTEVEAGSNVNIASRTGDNGQTIYTVNAHNTTAASVSPDYISVAGKPATAANTTNYEIGLTDKAITDFTKDTQSTVVSTDGTVTVKNADRNANGTVVYDLSVNTSVPTTELTTDKGNVSTTAPTSYVTAGNLATTINNAVASAKEKVVAGTNIASVDSQVDDATGATTFTVNAKGATASAGSDKVTVTPTAKDGNITDYAVDLSQAAKDSLNKADTAVQSFTTSVNGTQAEVIDQANKDVNFVNGTGTTARNDGGNITFDVNKADLTTDTAGNVTSNKAGDNFVTGDDVADAINKAAELTEKTTTVVKGSNTHVKSKVEGNNTEYTVSADKSTVSVSDALKMQATPTTDANEAVTTEYALDLSDKTKEDIKKGVDAKDTVDNKGLTFTGDSGSTNVEKLGSTVAVNGDTNIVTSAAGDAISIKLKDDITVNSVTANTTTTTNLTVKPNGNVDMGGNQITNVASGGDVNTNAANIGDVKKAKTEVKAGTNIVDVVKTEGDNGQDIYTVNAKDTTATHAASSAEFLTVSDAQDKGNNVKNFETALTTRAVDALKAAETAVQNFKVAVNGADVQTVANGDTVKFVNGTGTTARNASGQITFDINKSTLTTDDAGNVTNNTAGDTFVTGDDVAKAINEAAERTEKTTSVVKGSNTHVQSKVDGNNTEYTVSADKSTVSVSDALKMQATPTTDANEAVTTEYALDLSDKTKEDIKKGVDAKDIVDTKGLTFTGDSGTTSEKLLGTSVAVNGDDNITTEATADAINIKLNKDITVDSVTANTVNVGPVTINNDGIDAGNKTITNVANGTAPNDAVNVSQLNAAKTEVTGSGLANVTNTTGANGQTIYNVDVAKAETPTVTRGNVEVKQGDENKVMTAGDVANAINGSEKTSSVKAGSDKVTVQAGTEDDKGNTEYTVDLSADVKAQIAKEESVTAGNNNLTVEQDVKNATGGNNYKVTLSNNLDLGNTGSVKTGDTTVNNDGVTINNGNTNNSPVSLTKNGLDNGGNKITNVANGTAPTDAVNVSQLQTQTAASKEEVKSEDQSVTVNTTKNADGANVYDLSVNVDDTTITKTADGKLTANTTSLKDDDTDGKVDEPQGDDAKKLVNAGDIANAINNSGWKAKSGGNKAAGDQADETLINPSEVVEFNAGNNLEVKRVDNVFTFETKKEVTFDKVTVGPVTIDKTDGINAGNKQIKGVEAGTADTDAVNVSQLKSNIAESKWTLQTSQDNAAVSKVGDINPDDKVTIDGKGVVKVTNTVEAGNESKVHIEVETQAMKVENGTATTEGNSSTNNAAPNPDALATVGDIIDVVNNVSWSIHQNADPKVNDVKAGNEVHFVDSDEFTAKVTADGTTKTNVTFSAKTTQLKDENNDGKVDAPNTDNTKKLVNAGDIANAINNSGFKAKANGDDGELINPGDEVDFIDGSNIAITRDGGKFTVATKKDVTFDSVTFGDNGPKITNNGGNINVGGPNGAPVKITNVADGDVTADSKDAVNGSQLYTQVMASREEVKSDDKSVTVTTTQNDAGANVYDLSVNVDETTITKTPDGKLTANTTTLADADNDGKVDDLADDKKGNLITAGDVATAINASGFKAKANGDAGELINPGDVVDFKDGKNITVTRDGANFTFATKDDVNFNSVTFGDNGPKITNNGGNINVGGPNGAPVKVTNVADGDVNADSKDAVNGSQLYTQVMASREEVKSDDKSVTVTTTQNDAGANVYDLSVNVDGTTITKGDNGELKANTTELKDEDNDGKVDAPQGDDAKKLVNAGDITNAINASGFKAKANGDEGELINPGDEVEFINGSNIEITREGGKFTVATAKDVTFDSVTFGDNGPKITNNGGNINVGGPNGAPVKITNVADGDVNADSKDAVNGSQLYTQVMASREEVKSDDKSVTVTTTQNDAGANVYDLSVNVDGTTITKGDNGELKANTTTLADADNDGKVDDLADDKKGNLITAGDVATAINASGFKAKANGDAGELINPGDEVDFINGSNIEITREGGKFTVATKKDVTFDSVTFGDNGPKITNNGGNINVAGNDGSPTKITGVKAGEADTDAVNVSQLEAAKAAATTKVKGDQGVTVTSEDNADGSKTYTVAAKTDNTTVKVDDNGNIAAVTSDLTNNPEGKVNAPAAPNALVTAQTVTDAINNAGFNLQANGDAKSLVKTGDTVQFLNGDNIVITRNGNDIKVGTTKEVTFDKVTVGPVTINKDSGIDAGDTKITGVKAGTDANDAVNVSQLNNQIAASKEVVKSDDKSVTVVTTQNAEGANVFDLSVNTDDVTITKTPDGKVTANTTALDDADTDGKVDAPQGDDAKKLVNAGDIANAINKAGFTLKTSATADGQKTSGSDELINAGDMVDMVAGKNLTVKQEANGKVTYATKDDVTFNTVNSTTVVVGNPTDPAKSTTLTSGDKGLDVGGDKITNVADGDISPVSTDVVNGSQLNNYTKVNGQNIGTDNGAINIVNGNGTTVTSDKAGELKVNVNSTDLTVADNGTINVQDPNGTGSHFVNATTVAKAVNNVSWNVNSEKDEATANAATKNTYTAGNNKVKAGDTVKVNAGRNVEISGSGKNINVAVSDNPEFNSVKVGKGKDATTISSDADGVRIAKADGSPQRITNVAAGRADNDAVNVGQLKGAVGDLNNKINRNQREARAGIAGAAAIAGLPEIHLAGKSMVATAASTYKGENAIAVGYSRLSDNSKIKLKITGSADTKGDFIGTVGVGYAW